MSSIGDKLTESITVNISTGKERKIQYYALWNGGTSKEKNENVSTDLRKTESWSSIFANWAECRRACRAQLGQDTENQNSLYDVLHCIAYGCI